jgi:hypothetical protein
VLLALVVPMTKPSPTRAKLAIAMRMYRVNRTDSTATPIEAEILNRFSHKVLRMNYSVSRGISDVHCSTTADANMNYLPWKDDLV